LPLAASRYLVDPLTTQAPTLSLHDALPISGGLRPRHRRDPGIRRPRAPRLMLSRRRLSGRLRAVLELDDPPPRIALALAVGVFVGCTPFVGVQTLLSLVIALAFRLNRAATIAGT